MATSGQYSRSILGASDEVRDVNCEPCHQAGREVIAEGYCVDCAKYLCGQCYISHRRNKILANHVLLDKDTMPIAPDYSRGILNVCEEKCLNHPSKVTEFFCETCDKLGCHVCVTLNHRQCETVKHIPDIVKDVEQTEEFKEFIDDIQSKVKAISIHEKKLEANVTSNNEMRKIANQELASQRAEVNKFFDQLEKRMGNEITAIEKRNKDTLKAASHMLDQIKEELNQIKNDIEEQKTGKNCELFIAMKRGKEQMLTLDDQFNTIQGETIQQFTLLPSEQIEAMMRSTTEIGRLATARLESVIDLKTRTDQEEPIVNSLTIMHGHYCIVVDDKNKSVKVIDTRSKHVTSEKGIKAVVIWAVTSVSEEQVAISVSSTDDKDQIQFFTVSASGVIKRTKLNNVDKWYQSMVHYKGDIYGRQMMMIDVLNMRGKIIRTIQPEDNDKELFCLQREIALSPDGQTLYVSRKNSVISMTLDGKVKAFYNDKDLKNPSGITVDKHGYVYVRSTDTENIHQLTADLNKVPVLIDNVHGTNITYSSAEHKLYINNFNQINQYSLDFK